MTHPVLTLQPLTAAACRPYGQAWGLGVGVDAADEDAQHFSPASDFWPEHQFDAGDGAGTQVLWVVYRNRSDEVASLERHLLTPQAVVPLTGAVVQVVACSGADGLPDLATLAAFHVPPGQALCMAPGCWHATRVLSPGEVRCAMLTRASTTRDLVRALRGGGTPSESAFAAIAPHRWRA